MGAAEVELATRCLRAAGASLETGDREPVYALLAEDVEWVVPMRTLQGIDEVRKERAEQHLSEGYSVREVARLLGFADASAFHRAFKRWSGATPQEFRRRCPPVGSAVP